MSAMFLKDAAFSSELRVVVRSILYAIQENWAMCIVNRDIEQLSIYTSSCTMQNFLDDVFQYTSTP
jgi:hypothetical protein